MHRTMQISFQNTLQPCKITSWGGNDTRKHIKVRTSVFKRVSVNTNADVQCRYRCDWFSDNE